MDFSFSYPSGQPNTFLGLLNSQQENYPHDEVEQISNSSQSATKERRERRPWIPSDDVLLISAWLNTSKDPVVGNEQKGGAFWQRIAAYFAATCREKDCEPRDATQCKQRWHKINDLVSKFCGSYDAATRERTSGQNETDVLKLAHQIFYANHNKKFTLDHAWQELKNDQKWCEMSTTKTDASSKRRRVDEGPESPLSWAEGEYSTNRPPGVKAAKCKGKRNGDGNTISVFQEMWSIKEEDFARKERLSRMGLLDRLLAKKVPLSECEEAFKVKLIAELMD